MSLLAMWAPAIVTLLGVIFGAGKIYGRIGGQEITLARHDSQLIDHGSRIDTLEMQAERAKGWREGFTAGKGHGDDKP